MLVAIGRGYSYDFENRRFVLNGLLILASEPNNADVFINGEFEKRRTPYRTTLEEGKYNVELKREGFRTWRKTLDIIASEVTYAQYVILFPERMETKRLLQTAPVTRLLNSEDRKRFAYITAGEAPGVWLLDSDLKGATKVYTPKEATPEAPAEVISDVLWSKDNSRMIVKTSSGVMLVDLGSNFATTNLTEKYGFDFSSIAFNPSNSRELYWISPEGLRRVDTGAETVSAVLADKVSAFAFTEDRILYIQSTKLGKSLYSLNRDGNQQELIQSLAESDGYQIITGKYRDADILAIIPNATSTLTIYLDAYTSAPESKVVAKNVSQMKLSDDGRYLGFYSSNSFGSFDFEKEKTYSKTLEKPLTYLGWFDTTHFILNIDGTVKVTDFDTTNEVEITKTEPGQAAYATKDLRLFFSLLPKESGLELASTNLRPL